ncbi:phosphopyruvate hydratase [Caminibacter sp.]
MIDFDDVFQKKKFDFRVVIIIAASLLIAVYIVDLMFGKKSFSNLVDLQNSVKVMQKKVKELKKENALLQKSYFELKELEGE